MVSFTPVLTYARSYIRDEEGVGIIEFTIVVLPIIAIMLFVIDIGARYIIVGNVHALALAVVNEIENTPALSYIRDPSIFTAARNNTSNTVTPDDQVLAAWVREACESIGNGLIVPCNANSNSPNAITIDLRPQDMDVPGVPFYFLQVIYPWGAVLPLPRLGLVDTIFPPDVRSPWIAVYPRHS